MLINLSFYKAVLEVVQFISEYSLQVRCQLYIWTLNQHIRNCVSHGLMFYMTVLFIPVILEDQELSKGVFYFCVMVSVYLWVKQIHLLLTKEVAISYLWSIKDVIYLYLICVFYLTQTPCMIWLFQKEWIGYRKIEFIRSQYCGYYVSLSKVSH